MFIIHFVGHVYDYYIYFDDHHDYHHYYYDHGRRGSHLAPQTPLSREGGRVLVNWRRAGAEDRDHHGICISVFLFVYFYLLGFYIPSLCFLSNKSSFAELSPCKQPVFQDKSNNQGRDGKQKLSPLLSKLSTKYFSIF